MPTSYGICSPNGFLCRLADGWVAPTTTATMTYQHPWLGQATASMVDPDGLALKTATTYEQPGGSGWLRRLTRALPGATVAGAPASAQTTSAYYGDLENAPAVCGIPAGTKQAGLVKSTTGPTPAAGSAITRRGSLLANVLPAVHPHKGITLSNVLHAKTPSTSTISAGNASCCGVMPPSSQMTQPASLA